MSGKKTQSRTHQVKKKLPPKKLSKIMKQPLGKGKLKMKTNQQECRVEILERPKTPIQSIRLDMMAPNDDPVAFLLAFEQAVEDAVLPRELWAELLAPLLSGDAKAIVQDLPHSTAEDYDQMKSAILDIEERCRKNFRNLTFSASAKPQTIAHQLRDWGRRWLKPEVHSSEEIVELIIVEQFIHILPENVWQWLSSRQASCLDSAVQLIEGFLTDKVVHSDPEDVISDVDKYSREEETQTEGSTSTKTGGLCSIPEEGTAYNTDHQDSGGSENNDKDKENMFMNLDVDEYPEECTEGLDQQKISTRKVQAGAPCYSKQEKIVQKMQRIFGEKSLDQSTDSGRSICKSTDICEQLKNAKENRPYMCIVCKKRFRVQYQLKTHMTVHTGEKPFVCTVCGASFRTKGTLNVHQSVHSEVKPYACDKCEKRFTQLQNLKYHRQRVHALYKLNACT